jgi:hypothetical protein
LVQVLARTDVVADILVAAFHLGPLGNMGKTEFTQDFMETSVVGRLVIHVDGTDQGILVTMDFQGTDLAGGSVVPADGAEEFQVGGQALAVAMDNFLADIQVVSPEVFREVAMDNIQAASQVDFLAVSRDNFQVDFLVSSQVGSLDNFLAGIREDFQEDFQDSSQVEGLVPGNGKWRCSSV